MTAKTSKIVYTTAFAECLRTCVPSTDALAHLC